MRGGVGKRGAEHTLMPCSFRLGLRGMGRNPRVPSRPGLIFFRGPCMRSPGPGWGKFSARSTPNPRYRKIVSETIFLFPSRHGARLPRLFTAQGFGGGGRSGRRREIREQHISSRHRSPSRFSRRRSPSLLPRFGFTGCGRGQQPGHQEAEFVCELFCTLIFFLFS
uniref:Uncharacterized protein n=1 Tax=Oryza meridionalis TaxID=40149 RepID=A0A0E0DG40_9ORYZ